MLSWAAGRGKGAESEQQLIASHELANPERLCSTGKVRLLLGLAALSRAVLSRLLSPPSPASTVLNWLQIALLYHRFLLMEVLRGMQIVMIINEGNL